VDTTNTSAAVAPDNFELWLSTLPKWLQTAAADVIVGQKMPDDAGIQVLVDLCIAETSGTPATFRSIPSGAFSIESAGPVVRLKAIDGAQGVNALSPKAKLDFGDQSIVVVYGENGTGKSGFSRLLKHARGGKSKRQLLTNVFDQNSPPQSATFHIDRAGVTTQVIWGAANGPAQELRHIHIFDTDAAVDYVGSKAEATYEPRRLRFLSALSTICDKVKAGIVARGDALPSRMPRLPEHLSITIVGKFLLSLKATTKVADIERTCALAPDHATDKAGLDDVLRRPDPQARLTEVQRQIARLKEQEVTLGQFDVSLSSDSASTLLTAKEAALLKRRAAITAAELVFERAPLKAVGDSTWRELWAAAKAYSTSVAYPGCSFPHTESGARCPLCQQALAADAAERLQAFDSFIQNTLVREAESAEKAVEALIRSLPTLPSEGDWRGRFSLFPTLEGAADEFLAAARKRIDCLKSATAVEELPPWGEEHLREALAERKGLLEEEVKLLTQAVTEAKRAELKARLFELEAKEWANINQAALKAEFARLNQAAALEKAERKAGTAPLTTKKKEIAEQELTNGYRERFATELRRLGGSRIKVAPKPLPAVKGKIEFTLGLNGAIGEVLPRDVLSEGESRIVGLATFLADVAVSGSKTPFVFDDPISSLDQEFEERVVTRLIELAAERQVIVFTHRLSLLTLITESVDAIEKRAKAAGEKPPVSCRTVALRRMGAHVGIPTETSLQEKKVESALTRLLDHRIPSIRKRQTTGDFEAYANELKSACSDFRILIERAVETELLDSVVVRFRRSVRTLNGFNRLARIGIDDCILLDNFMGKYSCYEHSQSPELPVAVPDVEDVASDIGILRDWVRSFEKKQPPRGPIPAVAAAP
jgi:hypothetical protein